MIFEKHLPTTLAEKVHPTRMIQAFPNLLEKTIHLPSNKNTCILSYPVILLSLFKHLFSNTPSQSFGPQHNSQGWTEVDSYPPAAAAVANNDSPGVKKKLQLRNQVSKNGSRTGSLNDKGFFTPEIIKLLSYCMYMYIYI